MSGYPSGPRARTQRLRLHALWLALAWLGACGRVNLDLLPQPFDAGDGGMDPGMWCSDIACTAPGCPGDDTKTSPGICGCGRSDQTDMDRDGAPDCVDFCPGVPDTQEDGSCACAAARGDQDGDGTPNCVDRCPFDNNKVSAGECGCGAPERDQDLDGTPDCNDECPNDSNKSRAGACGCGVIDEDTDLDGTADCIDRCTGATQSYTPDQSCGVGYCREQNVASTCMAGVETACVPGAQRNPDDTTCDGVDDDCDGQTDEDFPTTTISCGEGVCMRSGTRACVAGEIADSCTPGTATGSDTDCNGLDEDCNGAADDGYMGASHSCGVGACLATGAWSCIDGALVDSCAAPMMPSTTDTTCNNIDDDCNGQVDEDYVPMSTSCGVGACARSGMRSCDRGRVVDSCRAGTPATTRDSTCNNVDDDCDGRRDEDYAVTNTTCGRGYCAATGRRTCVNGAVVDSCTPGAPRSSTDDAFAPGNGVDDDCDGSVDEDVPPCNTSARTFEAGAHTVTVPGNCRSLTVRLWGGGGASGQPSGFGSSGAGGPGGYATATVLVNGAINVYVGNGGQDGCDAPGTNAGSSAYNGGRGGASSGANGADGMVSGGGSGGTPSLAGNGGRGYYGGGGGGQGYGGSSFSGVGGGGGAASALIVNGTRAAVAGGGGGGGGASTLSAFGAFGTSGGAGGSGCGGQGEGRAAHGGGAGGGGVCLGSSTQRGSGNSPANSSSIPSGRARGATGTCNAGGNGYAIITFAP